MITPATALNSCYSTFFNPEGGRKPLVEDKSNIMKSRCRAMRSSGCHLTIILKKQALIIGKLPGCSMPGSLGVRTKPLKETPAGPKNFMIMLQVEVTPIDHRCCLPRPHGGVGLRSSALTHFGFYGQATVEGDNTIQRQGAGGRLTRAKTSCFIG